MEGKAICPPFEILAFYTAFDFSWDAQFDFSGECHEMWEIVFLTDGAVECVEDGKVYLLEQGDTVLHAPMEFHRIRSARGTSPSGYIISFTVRGELPAVLKNGVFRLDDGEASAYCEICRKVIGFLRGEGDTAYAGQEAAALLTAYLIRLSAGREANTRLVTSRSALTYRRLVSAMTEGAREGKNLADIAAACYVSVSYLKALFRKYAGISPKEYYTRMRLQHAITLLQSGYGAAEVADMMSFSSPNYFTAFLRRHTGKTPTAYKKG